MSSGFSFGLSTPAKNTASTNVGSFGGGFNLNVPKTATVTPSNTGFGTQTGLNFSAGTAPPNFNFTPATSAPTAINTSQFNFGAPTASLASTATTSTAGVSAMPSLNFAFPATTSSFATPSSLAPSTTLLTFGLGGGNSSFTFGKPMGITSSTSSAPTLNFGTSNTGLSGGSIFDKSNMNTLTLNTAATTTPFVGLGGIDIGSTCPNLDETKQEYIKLKETQVPDEIARTVDGLKTYMKAQKSMSSDIGRTSTTKLSSVSSQISGMLLMLQEISNAVENNNSQIKLLRKDTSRTIQSLEMAQRTQDTGASLQFENVAPLQFFLNLADKYEQDLLSFRQQITFTEKHMQSLTNPQGVSVEDIKRGFRQINESFVSLAGRLHDLHQNVESQKEQYLNLRKYRLRDNTDVFAAMENNFEQMANSKVDVGPTPFSYITAMTGYSVSSIATTTTVSTQTMK